MSQKEAILQYLQSGKPLTPLKAQAEFRTMRLAAAIHVLRKEGHNIVTHRKKAFSGGFYAEYRLVQ